LPVAGKMPTKNKFFLSFFCLLRFEGTFTSAFKDKKSKELKSSRNQGFLTFLHVDGRIRIRIRTNNDRSGYTILCEMNEFKFASELSFAQIFDQ
jgi:hypothetical protein